MRRPPLIFMAGLQLSLAAILLSPVRAAESRRTGEGIPKLSSSPPEELRGMLGAVAHLREDVERQSRSGRVAPATLQRQVSLTLNEANLLLALGQSLVLSKDASGRDSLAKSVALLGGLLADPALAKSMTPAQLGSAHRLRGMGAFYLNDFATALKEFEASLKADSSSADSIWTAFMAAEEYFEQSSFKRALDLYRFVQRRSPVESKPHALARFKVAWSLVNLGDFSGAETELLWIAQSSKDEAFALDAARDLAFVASRTRSEVQLLSLFDQKLASTGARGMAFLRKATSTLESQGKLGARSPLRERALSLEKDPGAKVAIQLESIQGVAREYASMPHAQRVLEVLGAAASLPVEKRDPLEVSSEKVCRVFSETYAGRAQTPEKIGKPVIAATLQRLVAAHLEAFPKSLRKNQILGIWLDVCELEKDANCLVTVSERVIAETQNSTPAQGPMLERAYESRLIGLEMLHSSKGGPADPEVDSRFRAALAERLSNPASKNGAVAGAKLAQLQVTDKKYEDAIRTLTSVLKRQPSHEYWYGLKWAQLQAGDYPGVMASPKSMGIMALSGTPDPRLNSVLSEATLKLAAGSRESGDLAQMGANIQRFEQLSGDPAKVNVARDEWMEALLQKKSFTEAIQRLAGFPPAWHQRPEAVSLKARLLASVIEGGDLQRIGSWILNWPQANLKSSDAGLSLLGLLYWGGARSIPRERVRALEESQRSVWLSTVVLAQPDWAFAYFRQFSPVQAGERAMDSLAHRLLGRVPPGDPSNAKPVVAPATEFERSASRISFPGKLPMAKHTRALQAAIGRVKELRVGMVPALKGQSAEVQLRIIQSQLRLEQAAAAAIVASPLPSGLAPAQVAQYRDGLKQLAAEFEAQVTELDSARRKIEAKSRELEQAREAEERSRTLPVLANPDLLVPADQLSDGGAVRTVARLARAGNPWGAAMELERLRAAKLVEGAPYWRLRAWILASISASVEGVPGAKKQNPVLLRYLFDELSDASMQGVIEEWKSAAAKK